jgi:hypothetical protein
MGALDLVDWPADRTLALSGAAGSLRLPLTLRNTSAEALHLGEVSFAEVRLAGKGAPLKTDPVPVQVSLTGDGITRTQLRLRLDPATPPGRYEGQVRLGELTRTIAIDVLPDLRLQIRPDPLVIDVSAGLRPTAGIAVENRGNVALVIDLAGAYPLAREVPVAPDRLETAAETGNSLGAIFDLLTARRPAPALVPFGEVTISMPGGPERLLPGETRTIALALVLPEGLAPSARYHAFPPLYAEEAHLVVVTAAKPPPPKASPPTTPRTRGSPT